MQSLLLLNNVVKWLAPLFHIQEVPDSNLSPESGYPDGFPQTFHVNAGIVL
jgi:hypothetical protein